MIEEANLCPAVLGDFNSPFGRDFPTGHHLFAPGAFKAGVIGMPLGMIQVWLTESGDFVDHGRAKNLETNKSATPC
jgi:hypothetical protein